MALPDTCEAMTKDGAPCSARPLPGEQYCAWHSPTYAAQRTEWARDAGKARSNAARLRRHLGAESLALREVDGLLCLALKGVLSGDLEPGVATAAATVARAISSVRQVGALEERIADLEQRVSLEHAS